MEFHVFFPVLSHPSPPKSKFSSSWTFRCSRIMFCNNPRISQKFLQRLLKSWLKRGKKKLKPSSVTLHKMKYFHAFFSFTVIFLLRWISGNTNAQKDFIVQLPLKISLEHRSVAEILDGHRFIDPFCDRQKYMDKFSPQCSNTV